MKYQTYRILAQNQFISNNTRETGLNNNDLIIGPTGSGKTRNYVKPNIMQANESMIIADTKGNLRREVGEFLRKKGYRVIDIDFADMEKSKCGYNPLDFIRYDTKKQKYKEQDILTISNCLSPVMNDNDPFWDRAGQMYLESIIAYVLECLPKQEQNLLSVNRLLGLMGEPTFDKLFMELESINPDSFAIKRYQMIKNNQKAERMDASIKGVLAEKINPLCFDGAKNLFCNKCKINFTDLGRRKTAVFLTISDMERSMDRLVNLFYTQALQELCRSADRDYYDCRLKVPVRFILDDFATNAYIPDFDKIISVIRSREISVSLIIQSLSQLEAMYGEAKSKTIMNNCDNCLYLGGQDVDTAQYISMKANKTVQTILNMPLEEVFLFTRGREPKKVKKYNLTEHPEYYLLAEAKHQRNHQENNQENHQENDAERRYCYDSEENTVGRTNYKCKILSSK